MTAVVTAFVTAVGVGVAGAARDGSLARAVAGRVLEGDVVAVDRGHLEQAEDDHEEDERAERELDGRLAALPAQPADAGQPDHAPCRCTRMTSLTLIVPEATLMMPNRLSE